MADMEKGTGGTAPSGGEAGTNRKCGMDMDYVKSIDGILKIKMMGWSFLAFILCIFNGFQVFILFFGVVIFCGLFLSVGLFIVFAYSQEKKITRINIFLFDLAVSFIGTIAYFIVCIVTVFNILAPLMVAAAIFGFIAMVSFGASIWYNFKRWRQYKPQAQSSNQAQDITY